MNMSAVFSYEEIYNNLITFFVSDNFSGKWLLCPSDLMNNMLSNLVQYVVNGYSQIEYRETFSLTVCITYVCLLIQLAIEKGLTIH